MDAINFKQTNKQSKRKANTESTWCLEAVYTVQVGTQINTATVGNQRAGPLKN